VPLFDSFFFLQRRENSNYTGKGRSEEKGTIQSEVRKEKGSGMTAKG
jgi:hypothetical protein